MCESSYIDRCRPTRMSVLADRVSVLGCLELLVGRAGLGLPPPVADRPVGPAACKEAGRICQRVCIIGLELQGPSTGRLITQLVYDLGTLCYRQLAVPLATSLRVAPSAAL